MPLLKKNWISPLVALSFVILAGTGLLMIAHIKNHVIYCSHEAFGVVFIAAGVLHLLLNWPAFLACFRNTRKGLVIALTALLLVSVYVAGVPDTHRRPPESGAETRIGSESRSYGNTGQ